MEEYKYAGVELTPQIFSELMIILFDGKQFKRPMAIQTITEYHKQHGGMLTKKEYINVFKKACSYLKENGLTNIVQGTWKLNYKIKETQIVSQPDANIINYEADKVIGQGNSAVYVYYYDVHKRLSNLEGRNLFECKVGRSDVDALQRILSQAGTCCPELPHVALIILCENSHLLETTIHNILKIKNRHILSASGREWFMTSPKEIEDIYMSIV